MFSNGCQGSRSKNVNLEQRDAKIGASAGRILLAQINGKLNKGFKDNLAKSLDRLLRPRTQTKTSIINVRQSNINDQSKNKPKINRSYSTSLSGYKKKNCTALNDKKLICGGGERSKPKTTQAPSIATERLLKSRGDSIESRASWVPSLKNSLKRSWSLQSSNLSRRDHQQHRINDHTTRRQCGTHSGDGTGLLVCSSRRLKCAITQRVNEQRDSWLNNSKKLSLATVFILLNLLLPFFSYAAPLLATSAAARIQPIWLHDGLITIDPNSIESDTYAQPPKVLDADLLDQVLLRLGILSEQQQQQQTSPESVQSPQGTQEKPQVYEDGGPGQVSFGRRDGSWLQNAFRTYEVDPELSVDLNAPSLPDEELLEIQRRRLERDRALEPPPWLRRQPMRRGYNPIVEDASTSSGDGMQEERASFKEGSEQQQRLIQSRQSRELADQIYEELLRHIFEGALDEHRTVEELYEDLKQKLKTNRPSQAASRQPLQVLGNSISSIGGSDETQQRLLSPQQQQSVLQTPNKSASRNSIISPKESEPEATLVVVGDEVSSEDDVGSVIGNSGKNMPMSAAYTLQGSGPAYGNIQDSATDKLASSSENSNPSLAAAQTTANSDNTDGELIVGQSKTLNPAGIDLLSVIPIEQPSGSEHNANAYPLANSFHVIEDIDRDDGLQDTSMQQSDSVASTQDPGDFQQQQQSVEPSGWLNPGAIRVAKPILFSNYMKRSGPVTSTRWPKDQIDETETDENTIAISDGPDPKSNQTPNLDTRDQLAISLIESGYVSKGQLVGAATKLKIYLEQLIGLPKGSILGLYPLNGNQLLAKLDTNKLNYEQMFNMFKNYDFARGFILVNWPKGSQQSPLPLLSAISRVLNSKYGGVTGKNVGLIDIVGGPVEGNSPLEQELSESIQLPLEAPAGGELMEAASTGYDAALKSVAYDPQYMSSLAAENERVPILDLLYTRYTMNPQGGRLSMPALGAYLNALMAQDRLRSRALVDAAWTLAAESDRLKLPAVAYLGPLADGQQFAGRSNQSKAGDDNGKSYSYLIHLMALVAALLGSFLVVKLIMRGKGNQIIRRRLNQASSFWSNSSQSDTVAGPGNHKQSDLKAANLLGDARRESDSLAMDQEMHEPTDKTYNLDSLAQRLASLLYHRPFNKMRESPPPDYEEANDKKELDEASTIGGDLGDDQSKSLGANESRFRSSGSYIRSLIDVLSNARAQMNSNSRSSCVDPDELSSLADEEISKSTNLATTSDSGSNNGKQPEAGIVMSQMDISAAHLILAYMEKHLEDKERLRREWLELNAGPTRGTSAKIVQHMLQRLAKVALNDENRHKNRNPMVVPFDRNRVKLRSSFSAAMNPGGSTLMPWSAASSSSNNKLSSNARGVAARRPESPSTLNKGSDYINASYIYDDDLRRPTHIITQGPTEQTTGQFWQMVWEQGVSVIVMLTRLNENSIKMCHCYWPTNSDQEPARDGASANGHSPSATTNSTTTTTTNTSTTSKDDTNGAASLISVISEGASRKSLQVGGPASVSSESVNDGNGLAGNAKLATTIAPTNGAANTAAPSNGTRRVSVTSVFNTVGARLNLNGQPIIANGDLSNNILCFDVVSPSLDEENNKPASEVGISGDKQPQTGLSSSSSSMDKKSTTTTTTTRFEVHLVSEHVSSSDYLVRNMYMINRSTGETRTITQFHYLSWPENGVPDNVESFLQFRRKVHKSYRNLKSPILVHCSDGGGRSGTYTLIDIILERIKNGAKEIDPRATLEHLRDQRVGLCANQSQFEYVLVALAEEIQIILNALPQ